MKKALLLFFTLSCIPLSNAQVTLNGASVLEGGGRPSSCPTGTYKVKSAGTTNGNCIEITQNYANFLSGAFWYCDQLDLTQSFRFDFSINFGSDATGGDGIAFVLQNEGVSDVKGGAGGGLGYAQGDGGTNGSPCLSVTANDCPIRNSLAIEYDTWDNTPDGLNDLSCHHASMQTDGEMVAANTIAGPVCLTSTGADVVDGADHAGCITWDPAINEFVASFDGIKILTYSGDIRSILGNNAFWGFTAASGGVAQTQSVCDINIVTGTVSPDCALILSNDLVNFNANCQNGVTKIDWAVENASEIDHFKLLQSNDGLHFQMLDEISASSSLGSSTFTYALEQTSELMYYKIETVANNGEKSISSIISSDCSSSLTKNESIYIFPNPVKDLLTIVNRTQDIESIIVLDITGKPLMDRQVNTGQSHQISLKSLSSGVYGVYIKNKDGSSSLQHFVKQ